MLLRKINHVIMVILFIFMMLPPYLFAKDILIPVDNFPPFQIITPDGLPPHGEVISIIESVVKRVNLENHWNLNIKYIENLPFARCLYMMKNGQADLIGGILNKEDRSSYMHLLKYKPNSNKVFVLRKNETQDIINMNDLHGKIVGTVNGYVYFKKFDDDLLISKDPVRNLYLAFKKLEHSRNDSVICSETEWLNFRDAEPELINKFKLATLKHMNYNPVYIGLSKKSWVSEPKYLDAFSQTMDKMYHNKEFIKIISDFYQKNSDNL